MRRIRGVPVVGTGAQLPEAVGRLGATSVVVALPEADAATTGRVAGLARERGVEVKVLPIGAQLLSDHVGIRASATST